MSDDDLTQTTYYGYEKPGDPDYDSNSAAGIGDRDNALVDSISAALTQSERMDRFGVFGKSTGQEFEYAGRTLRDDDTAPESNRRVDIYSPGGPGPGYYVDDHEAQFNQALQDYQNEHMSDEEIHQKYLNFLPTYPAQTDEPPKQTPLTKIRQKYGKEYPGLTDDELINKVSSSFPDVPQDKLPVYLRDPNGDQLIKDEITKGLSPLDKFKTFYPQYSSGKTDDQIIQFLHDKTDPEMDMDRFKDKVNPPKPSTNVVSNSLMAGMQGVYGKWEKEPKDIANTIQDLYKVAGVYGWEQSASDWMKKSIPGYAGADDYYRSFVNNLYQRGKQWDKQAQQAKAAIPKDLGSKVVGTAGEIAGSIPDVAVSFGLGSTGKAAALFGMTYEGTSAYGEAVEEHQMNALPEAVQSAGFRGFSQLLMNTGRGRIVSGFANSIASAADVEVQKWLRGEPSSIDQDRDAAAVGFITGLLWSSHRGPAKTSAPEAAPKPDLSYAGGADTGADPVTPPTEDHKTSFTYSKAVNEELNKALEHQKNGNTNGAADHFDRGFSLMKDEEKREFAGEYADTVKGLASGSTEQAFRPDNEFNAQYFSGLPLPKMPKEGKLIGREIQGAFAPETLNPESETAGAIIKAEKGRGAALTVMEQADIARAAGKDWVESGRRENYFNKFSEQERIQMFLDYKDNKTLKDPTAEFLFRKIYKSYHEEMTKREEVYNITYPHRNNYFLQLLSHPKDDLEKLTRDITRRTGGLSFTKPREMDLALRLAMGHKMVTTNMERLMQIRWNAGEQAIQKIRIMREIADQGFAYRTDDPNIPYEAKSWGQEATQETVNGKHVNYHVSPAITAIINNSFDTRSLYRMGRVANGYMRLATTLKGLGAMKLNWSVFHPLHIAQIAGADIATEAQRRITLGVANKGDVFNAFTAQMPLMGLYHIGKAYMKVADEINALKGRLPWQNLSADQLENAKMFMDTGMKADMGHEREMQFASFIRDQLPEKIRAMSRGSPQVEDFAKVGWRALSGEWFTHWWFNELSPRIKMASAVMRRDTLARSNPDLFKPENRSELLKEYQKIGDDIEARYGEMNYDRLLWPRIAKELGTGHLLSLGWQIGFVKTNASAIIDMTHNAAHMDEIFKKGQMSKAASKAFTNRTLFWLNYNTAQLMTGAAITYIATQEIPTLWDMIYPRVGKDDQGKDKRVQMQGFMREFPSLAEHIKTQGPASGSEQWMLNKLTPGITATVQAVHNKDYMGKPIGNMTQIMQNWLGQMVEPITLENIKAQKHVGPGDAIMDMLGFSPSAKWTTRTDTENEIMTRAYNPDHRAMTDARDNYRTAFLAKDQQGMKAAREELKKLKVDDKSIKAIEKDAHLSSAEKAWRKLSKADKEEMLRKMPEEERKKWLKLSSKPVQHDLEHAGSVPQ